MTDTTGMNDIGTTELMPLTYVPPAPRPLPACEGPTPDEQARLLWEAKQTEITRMKAQSEQQQQQQGASATSDPFAPAEQQQQQQPAGEHNASGIFSSIKAAAQQVALNVRLGAAEVSAKTESQVRQLEHQRNYDRFRSVFYELAADGEVLLVDYGCHAMSNGVKVSGHMQITRNYLCFCAAPPISTSRIVDAFAKSGALGANRTNTADDTPAAAGHQSIKHVIPLHDIVSIQLAVALPTVDISNDTPYFLPLPDPCVVATALQVYTRTDNKLFQFLEFESFMARAGGALSSTVKGTPLDRAYNYLDHAWRARVTVPVEGVQYAS